MSDNVRYEIAESNVTDQNNHAFSATIRAAMNNAEEVQQWINEFSQKTNTAVGVRRTSSGVEEDLKKYFEALSLLQYWISVVAVASLTDFFC